MRIAATSVGFPSDRTDSAFGAFTVAASGLLGIPDSAPALGQQTRPRSRLDSDFGGTGLATAQATAAPERILEARNRPRRSQRTPRGWFPSGSRQESHMTSNGYSDNVSALVRYALETTRATTVCPFHDGVVIRVGDDGRKPRFRARQEDRQERRQLLGVRDLDRRDRPPARCRDGRPMPALRPEQRETVIVEATTARIRRAAAP